MKARLRPVPATLFCLAALGGFLVPLLFAREAGTLVATLLNGLRGTGLIGVCLFVLLEFLVAATGILPASLLGVGAGAVFGFVWVRRSPCSVRSRERSRGSTSGGEGCAVLASCRTA